VWKKKGEEEKEEYRGEINTGKIFWETKMSSKSGWRLKR